MPQDKKEKKYDRQSPYNAYGFEPSEEQREWLLRSGGRQHSGALYMIDSANKDYARDQAERAGAYRKTGRSSKRKDSRR